MAIKKITTTKTNTSIAGLLPSGWNLSSTLNAPTSFSSGSTTSKTAGKVGKYKDLIFYCRANDGKLENLGFSDLEVSSSANWEEHAVHLKKPYLEFTGPGLMEVSMTIVADASLGVAPLDVQSKLLKYEQQGKSGYLWLGSNKIGSLAAGGTANTFVITSISNAYEQVVQNGAVVKMTFDVEFKEYNMTRLTSSASKTTTGSSSSKSAKTTASTTYTTKKGDTLWKIAKALYGKGSAYKKILNKNKTTLKGKNKNSTLSAGIKLKVPKYTTSK